MNMEYNMPQDKEKIKDDSQKNFENALTRLEEIAAELEKGGLSLADMTALAKEGMELSDYCSAQLKDLETIQLQLQKDSPEGQTWKTFETDDDNA